MQDDAIDRAEAMTEIMMFAGNVKPDEEDIYIKVSDAVQLLRELPPVTQKSETVTEFADRCRECGARYGKLLKQKSGKWIAQDIHNCHTDFKCSECGYIHSFMHLYGEPTADYTYCPNCGVCMKEGRTLDEFIEDSKESEGNE